MTKEDVLIKFKEMSEPNLTISDMPGFGIFLGIYILLFLIVVIMMLAKVREGYGWIVVICFFVMIFHMMLNHGFNKKQSELGVESWRNQYAIPYINSLPKEKHEVIFVKIEASSSQKIKDNGLWLYSQEVQRTPLTISFKGDTGIETQTYWYATDMSLTPEQRPYVEYTVLPEDLGADKEGNVQFWAGRYNHKIYLPENYQFTDIK